MSRILFIVQLPPPVHGASLMNKLVYDRANRNPSNQCYLVKLNFARSLSDLQRFKPRKLLRAIVVLFELAWKLLRYRPNIIYFSMVPLGLVLIRDSLYLAVCKLCSPGARKIIHLHRPGLVQFYQNRRLIRQMYGIIFRNCELVHLTPLLAKNELEPLKLERSKITVIPNAIVKVNDLTRHKKDRNNILFLSNFFRHKGYLDLVDAFAMLSKNNPELSLTLAGAFVSEPDREELIQRIQMHNIADRVEVIGPVYGSHRFELYSRAGIFILPSRIEYFPLVILEAMSERCVVVTSGRENLKETFRHGQHLLFLNSLTPNAIACQIDELLMNPSLYDAVSQGGFTRFLELQKESLSKIDMLFSSENEE